MYCAVVCHYHQCVSAFCSILADISTFVLVADKSSIKMVSLEVEGLLPTHISISGSYQFDVVEYDPLGDEVYWIDSANGTILKVSRKVNIDTTCAMEE